MTADARAHADLLRDLSAPLAPDSLVRAAALAGAAALDALAAPAGDLAAADELIQNDERAALAAMERADYDWSKLSPSEALWVYAHYMLHGDDAEQAPTAEQLTRFLRAAATQIFALRAEVHALHGAMRADDARLRAAEARVWPDGTTYGCDAAEHLADAVLTHRAEVQALTAQRDEVQQEHTNYVTDTLCTVSEQGREIAQLRAKVETQAAEIAEAVKHLRHLSWCQTCGDESWDHEGGSTCEGGIAAGKWMRAALTPEVPHV